MGDLKKLTPQELDELREQLRKEQIQVHEEEQNEPATAQKRITVTVSEDRLSAFILVENPGNTETISREDIVSQLRKNNVVIGYQEDVITKLINKELYGEKVVIAKGQAPKQGQDGYFEFFFETEERKEPLIREDGTVDYSSMGRLQNIDAGDVIAKYHDAVQGLKGINVAGAELLPKVVRELSPLRGKNITRNVETNEYTANIAGKVSYSSGNIEILTVHEIHGDVDLVTGSVEFYGDIIISGNVEAGVMIRAGRNITVEGTVSSARLFAGGDIVLKKGIQGGEKGTISARKSVYADFIEYAKVDAGGDVSANSIINSTVKSGGNVILKGKRGSIMGGYIHAMHSISANTVGSISEMRTVLHTGFTEEEFRNLSSLMLQEKQIKQSADSLIERMTELLQSRQDGKMTFTTRQKENLLSMNERKNNLFKQLDDVTAKKKEVTDRMSLAMNSWISVSSDIYRGTIISIDVTKLLIQERDTYVRYICRNDKIERTAMMVV